MDEQINNIPFEQEVGIAWWRKVWKYFKSQRMGKMLLYAAGVLFVLAIGFAIYDYVTEKTSGVRDVRVTNITGTSVTVSWVSEEKHAGSVVYSENDSWFALLPAFGKDRAYDDRDIEEVEYGVYEVAERGNYYTHHVTVRGLSPSTKYYYKLSTGLRTVEPEGDLPALETGPIAEEVVSPDPVYGRVVDNNNAGVEDALVYLWLTDDEGAKSTFISTYTNETGGYSLDVANTLTQDLTERFNKRKVFEEAVMVQAGELGMKTYYADPDKDQPVGDIKLTGSEEVPTDEYWENTAGIFETKLGRALIQGVEASSAPGCGTNGPAHNYEAHEDQGTYPECCGCGKKRQVRKCFDRHANGGAGGTYFKVGSCDENDMGMCGGAANGCSQPKPEPGKDHACVGKIGAGKCVASTDSKAPSGMRDPAKQCDQGNSVHMEVCCNKDTGYYRKAGGADDCGGRGCTNGECNADYTETEGDKGTCELSSCHSGTGCCGSTGKCYGAKSMGIDGWWYCEGNGEWTKCATADCCNERSDVECEVEEKEEVKPFPGECEGWEGNKTCEDLGYGEGACCGNASKTCYERGRYGKSGEWKCVGKESGSGATHPGGWMSCPNGVCPDEEIVQESLFTVKGETNLNFIILRGSKEKYVYWINLSSTSGDLRFNLVNTGCPERKKVTDQVDECVDTRNGIKITYPSAWGFGVAVGVEFEGSVDEIGSFSREFSISYRNSINDEIGKISLNVRVEIVESTDFPGCPPLGYINYDHLEIPVEELGICTSNIVNYGEISNTCRKNYAKWLGGDTWTRAGFVADCNNIANPECEILSDTEVRCVEKKIVSAIEINEMIKDRCSFKAREGSVGWNRGDAHFLTTWCGKWNNTFSSVIGSLAVEKIDSGGIAGGYVNDTILLSETLWQSFDRLERVALHEFGHAITEQKCGVTSGGLGKFSGLMGWTRLGSEWSHPCKQIKKEGKYEKVECKEEHLPVPTTDVSINPAEDLAESIRYYLTKADALKASSPTRYSFVRDVIFGSQSCYSYQGESNELPGIVSVSQAKNEGKEGLCEDGACYDTFEFLLGYHLSEDYSYDLRQGWNLVAFPKVTEDVKTADKLLEKIALAGGYATHVTTYRHGKWLIFSKRGDVSFSKDFNILPGEGYFIKVHSPAEFEINELAEESLPINLEIGWNLVGVVSPDTYYTADSLLDTMVTQKIGADTVTKWDAGRYENYIRQDNLSYGNDFKIFEVGGYFVRVKESGGEFKP